MSLALALNTALSGLNVNQRALSVLSQNIANANTPGYSRKNLELSSIFLNGNGAGASIDNITRKVDEYLVRAVRLQSSVVGRAAAAADYADRTQLLLGTPGAGNSFNAYATHFFGSLQSLAQTPEDGTLKNSAVTTGVTLARQISQLANNLQDMRYQADQDLSTSITIINNNLQQIFTLNATITQNLAQGRQVTELLDKRDQAIADISQYLDVQTFVRDNGAINLSCNGIAMLDDSLFQLSYLNITSVDQLANNAAMAPVQVYRSDDAGNLTGNPVTLITGGTSDQVVSAVTSGKIKAMLDQRDRVLPNMLSQLDLFAATLRDRFNAIHNAGSAFPGANSLTGTRALVASQYTEWTGKMRLAVLKADGTPVPAAYTNMTNGMPPLTIDLSLLNTGNGAGKPSLQGIINEINQYYGAPQNKVQVGNISNIRLASLSTRLPGTPPQFSFDLDLENLSSLDANVFVTGVTVQDSTGATLPTLTDPPPSIDIAATSGFVTEMDSAIVTVNTGSAHGLSEGDTIYLPSITAGMIGAATLNGIPLSELSGKAFTVSNITSTSFQISVTSEATSTGGVNTTGATLLPTYGEVEAGESARKGSPITASLTGYTSSPYYTVTVAVAVADENGVVKTSNVTYRVTNNQTNLLNDRYAARTADGDGTIHAPTNNQTLARAIMVDADGVELPKINGEYTTDQQGFLKIVAGSSAYTVAIDSLDSADQGVSDGVSPVDATGYGFSHYFHLNDFFVSSGDDAVAGSALNLAVVQRLIDDPSLISLGSLVAVGGDDAEANAVASYTYQRTIGDNSFIQQLADLGIGGIAFTAAGGLGATTQSFTGYASQIIASASLSAASVKSEAINAQTLLDGYVTKNSAISGVNLDEELANTVIYQNAYAASARVITVANNLFDTLLNTFGG